MTKLEKTMNSNDRKAYFSKKHSSLEYFYSTNSTKVTNCESVKYARFLIASCGVAQELIKI